MSSIMPAPWSGVSSSSTEMISGSVQDVHRAAEEEEAILGKGLL